nr:transposase [Methanobacterium subterraneum]
MVINQTCYHQKHHKITRQHIRVLRHKRTKHNRFQRSLKKEDITEFLKLIRAINPYGRIMIILDNFRSHHANLTTQTAAKLNIDLVFLPPYSPHLKPIEFI